MRHIYIAGKFGERKRLAHERDRIERLGLGKVVSTWIDCAHDAETPAENETEARRDLLEVLSANLLVIETVEPTRRGARETELGIAIGAGIEAWLIGPKRSVFHHMLPKFWSWDEVLDALAKEIE